MKTWLRLLPGLLIGAVLLWLSLRSVDLAQAARVFSGVHLGLLLAAVVVGQAANWLRAWRWRRLLRHPPGLGGVFAAMMIGYFANNALPARLGELARIESLKRRYGTPRGEAFVSIVVEKVYDGLTLCFALGAVLLVHDFPPWVSWVGRASFVLFAGALAAAALCLRHRPAMLALLARLARPLGRFSAPLLRFAESAAEGLEQLRRPSALLSGLALSFSVWGVEAISVWILLRSAGLQVGPGAALFLIAILGLGMLVPSPPGFVGTYEYFGSRALGALAVAPAQAVGVTVLLHLQFLLATLVVGFICLLATGGGLAAMTRPGIPR